MGIIPSQTIRRHHYDRIELTPLHTIAESIQRRAIQPCATHAFISILMRWQQTPSLLLNVSMEGLHPTGNHSFLLLIGVETLAYSATSMIVLLLFRNDRECAPQPFPYRSGFATEVWCRTNNRFITPLQVSILREENDESEAGSALPVPLQFLHLRMDHQVYRFMSCNCDIELVFKSWKRDLHLAQLPTNQGHPIRPHCSRATCVSSPY